MSTSAVSNTSLYQQLQGYFQERRVDLNQLGQALKSGNLDAAQTAYNTILSLGQGGPFASGAPFELANREHDFQAIGQALQAGDLSGATQAFQTLQATFRQPQPGPAAANNSSSMGPDVVVSLSGNQ
ncbi:MAG TPA: hypothetical protein VEG68_09795 [Terriglobales bacterium]|nr:hypothetical protein [Terriglobales bacterium]